MKHSCRSPIAKNLCLFLLLASCVLAGDWPQWRGPNRDGKVTDFTAPKEWPQKLTEKWKATVGTGDATPALVGSKLYVFARQGDNEVTLCLDANTGKELWKDQYAAQAVTGAASRHPGPRSSLAVAEGKVVTLGVGGVVSCLNADTGKMEWRKDPFPKIVPRFFTSTSPLIVDGMVISHLGGQGNGAIMAFALADGQEKWKWAGEGPDYGSPALLTVDGVKQVVTLTEKSIVGVGWRMGSSCGSFRLYRRAGLITPPRRLSMGRRLSIPAPAGVPLPSRLKNRARPLPPRRCGAIRMSACNIIRRSCMRASCTACPAAATCFVWMLKPERRPGSIPIPAIEADLGRLSMRGRFCWPCPAAPRC